MVKVKYGTLADFKRFLIVGAVLTMEYYRYTPRHALPWHRKVVRATSAGVYMVDPTEANSKESFFRYPKPNEVVWDGPNRVLIYQDGEHLLSYKLATGIDPRGWKGKGGK